MSNERQPGYYRVRKNGNWYIIYFPVDMNPEIDSFRDDYWDEIDEHPIPAEPPAEIRNVIKKWSLILLQDEGKDIVYDRNILREMLADFTASSIIDSSTEPPQSVKVTNEEIRKIFKERHGFGGASAYDDGFENGFFDGYRQAMRDQMNKKEEK